MLTQAAFYSGGRCFWSANLASGLAAGLRKIRLA
jgi:hypothetical protein